jgi:hypothetical protein
VLAGRNNSLEGPVALFLLVPHLLVVMKRMTEEFEKEGYYCYFHFSVVVFQQEEQKLQFGSRQKLAQRCDSTWQDADDPFRQTAPVEGLATESCCHPSRCQ